MTTGVPFLAVYRGDMPRRPTAIDTSVPACRQLRRVNLCGLLGSNATPSLFHID